MSHYNAPAVPENVKDFRLAGSGAITFPKGRVRLESLRPPEDSQEANIVLWCPEGFGGDVAIEGDIAFSVNGLKNFRRRDEPPLSSGKIGFCQMAPLIGEYANPKVTLP